MSAWLCIPQEKDYRIDDFFEDIDSSSEETEKDEFALKNVKN